MEMPTLSLWIDLILYLVYILMIVSCVIVVLSENRSPIRSLAWVIALIFLPVAGLLFYLFFGRSPKSLYLNARHHKRKILHDQHTPKVNLAELPIPSAEKGTVRLADRLGHSPLTVNNEIEIFTNGADKFAALKKDLLAARKFILLQYYIFNDDELGREIADILIKKAEEGLNVKVLYDHVGSFSASNRFFRRMERAGVKTQPFFRVTFPQLANRINWRNHRKIVVIDGTIGYIGGMNIANRYIGLRQTRVTPGMKRRLRRDPRFLRADSSRPGDAWRDTHFRLRGDIVSSLTYSFTLDWNFMAKHPEPMPRPAESERPQIHNDLAIQLVASGPVNRWDSLSMTFLKAIGTAKKSIYIQTPYFLPTEALLTALQTAALAGTDVRIMIPRRCDSKMLQYASFSYVTQCLQAGIKVYLYDPGMIHAKTMTVDDGFTTAGSTNFDFRSFENNFECNLMIYSEDVNRRMRDIFFDDLERCTKLTYSFWKQRPLYERVLESLLRLFAPIL